MYSAKVIDGKQLADSIKEELKSKILSLQKCILIHLHS